jgi:two-component system, chemotaxis family, protein-glutamate methylesterase/glutaminase
MLVDDAVVVRHVLSDALSSDPDIEVVGTASDGVLALEKLPKFNPDVVVLDVEMPNKDGIETLADIKKLHPRVRVIMFSTLTSNGANATVDALLLGADDYATKPSNTGSMAASIEVIKNELAPKIKSLYKSTVRPTAAPHILPPKSRPGPVVAPANRLPASAPRDVVAAAPRRMVPGAPHILAIAVSTGGPNALAELIPAFPADLAVPVVIVQHIPALFSKALAERLDQKSAVRVHEGQHGDVIQPGHVYLAPGGKHMLVKHVGAEIGLELNEQPPENSCRPAADVLFRSVAAVYGQSALGLVLTGMGYDGLKGSQALVNAGGRVIAQDEASSVVWGMPGAVVSNGVAEAAFPLAELAKEIQARLSGVRSAR